MSLIFSLSAEQFCDWRKQKQGYSKKVLIYYTIWTLLYLPLAAPIAPGPVNITEITNTSMVVTWNPPKSMNGALRNYDVFYGGTSKRLNMNTNVCINISDFFKQILEVQRSSRVS
jgi:hypothetical protein